MNKEDMKKIGSYILNGMTEREGCILAGINTNDLDMLKEQNEQVRLYFEKKHIQFKFNNLQAIQGKKSEKTSQWLLEKLRPDEFGAKSKAPDGPTINIVGSIIKEIQNDDTNIVRQSRGARLIEQRQSNEDDSDGRIRVAHLS